MGEEQNIVKMRKKSGPEPVDTLQTMGWLGTNSL